MAHAAAREAEEEAGVLGDVRSLGEAGQFAYLARGGVRCEATVFVLEARARPVRPRSQRARLRAPRRTPWHLPQAPVAFYIGPPGDVRVCSVCAGAGGVGTLAGAAQQAAALGEPGRGAEVLQAPLDARGARYHSHAHAGHERSAGLDTQRVARRCRNVFK